MPHTYKHDFVSNNRNRAIWLIVISSILALGILLGMSFYTDYRREVNLLEERLMAQAKVVEENLNANLASVNLILENIQQEMGENYRHETNYLNSYLKKQAKLFPGIRTLLIIDSRGLCVYSNQDVLPGNNFNYRDYFTTPRDAADKNQLFISPPFKTVLNTFSINVSKPILGKQGDFQGVISVSLSPDYFHSLLQSTIFAADNRIALLHSDGTVSAAAPESAKSIVGQNLLKPGTQFFNHAQSGKALSIQRGQSATTGDIRVFAYMTNSPKDLRLDKHLVVVSSRNLDVVLMPWKIRSGIELSVFILFSSIAVLGTKKLLMRNAEKFKQAEFNRALLDSVQAHIAILDQDGIIVSVNVAWQEFAKNNCTESGELPIHTDVGANYIAVCRESSGDFSDQAAEAAAGIIAVLNGSEKSFFLEYPCHSPDTERWFFMTVEPLQTPEGGAIVTHTNISNRKLMEDALRQSEERFQKMFRSHGAVMLLIDPESGTIIDANLSAETYYGYPLATLQQMNIAEINTLSPDDIHTEMRHARLQERSYFNFEHKRADGSIRSVEVYTTPIPVLGKPLLFSIIHDITERKHVEEELKESKQQLANIIDFLPDATFVIDNDKKVIAWNRAIEEMSGVAKEDIIGLGDYVYSIPFYGERRKQLLDLLDISDAELEARYQHIQRKGKTLDAEVFVPAIYAGKGAYVWASGAPLYSTDNKRVGAIEIIRDITELKKVEQALRDAKEAAEDANRAKSEFLANMSHEIRTPMNAITGMAYLVQQTGLDARQREYVTRIRGAADSLLGIINDILDFSKIEAGKMELESVTFELKELFDSVHTITAARTEGKNLEVTFSIAPGTPALLIGDQLRLRQILSNLVSNAIKFTEKGNVQITVTPAGDVSRADRVPLTFSIADTGIGMESEQLQRILAPFTQADNSISRRYGGTGLGLSIVSRLLALMGSTLEVVSMPGHGSTFTFTVEFGLPPEIMYKALFPPEELRQMRVLVVDDSIDACQMLESMLTELSFIPTVVHSGAAALEELIRAAAHAEPPYRLILLDWRMPGMDGLETARSIRNCQLPAYPEIIIISGYIATDIQEKGMELGISVYLNKPFDLVALFNGIVTVFGKEQKSLIPQPYSGNHADRKPVQLRNATVLLVEDDKVNQIVAQEILKHLGAVVVTTDNGISGVSAALGSAEFDLVFMDIQMPGMNGYEAATAIRQVKGELELPIIAMTAHAFSDERDRCLAAGMNDHIAKPIDPDQLYSVMLKWLPSEKVTTTPSQNISTGNEVSPLILPDKLPGIDIAAVVRRCKGNEYLAREIIINFREQHQNTCNELCCALESGNRTRALQLVHTLKGLAGTIGATSLAATVSALETGLNGESGSSQLLIPDIMEQQLHEVFEAAEILARIHIDETSDSVRRQLANEELIPLLNELLDALRNNSLGATKLFERIKQNLHQSDRDEICRYMERLDFEMALAALERAVHFLGIKLQRDV